MIVILKAINNLLNDIKRKERYKNFKKYSEFGAGLDLNTHANCSADKQGMIKIGEDCRIYGSLESQEDGKITIGDHTCIYSKTHIGSVDSVTIGKCVIISNHVHIYDNNNHPTSPEVRETMCMGSFDGDAWRWRYAASAPIVIEDNVWIGEYSAIMKGVTVGKGSIVAAHSVVTKDVPPYSIVAGNPAKVVKTLENKE